MGGKGRREKNLQIPSIGNFDRIAQYPHFCNRKCWIKCLLLTWMLRRAGYPWERERERVLHLEPTMRKKKRERNLLEGRGTLFHRTAESSWPRTWNQTDRRGESSRDKRQEGFRVCNMKLATIKDGRNGDDANERDGKEREAKRSGARKERVGPRRGRQSYPCLPDGKRPLAGTAVKFNGVKSVGQE